MRLRFDLVLFDLDGTLIDSRADIAAAVNHARAGFGKPPLAVAVVETYVGDGVRLLMERALETSEAAALDRGIALWREYYIPHCLDATRPYEGVVAMLQALAGAGARLGVVSNKPASPSEKILSGLGLRGLFAAVVGGDSTPGRKPDPEPLRVAARTAGAASGRVLMVGDSPNDILGARNAGYASCGVLWGIGAAERVLAAHPDHVARAPADVLVAAGLG